MSKFCAVHLTVGDKIKGKLRWVFVSTLFGDKMHDGGC